MVTRGKPDPRINRLIAYLKEANDGMMDRSEGYNRRDCKTMIQRMAKRFPTFDPEEAVKRLIDVGKKDPFHGRNLTSFNYLVQHGVAIIEAAKRAKSAGKQQSTNEYAHSAADALARKLADSGS